MATAVPSSFAVYIWLWHTLSVYGAKDIVVTC